MKHHDSLFFTLKIEGPKVHNFDPRKRRTAGDSKRLWIPEIYLTLYGGPRSC